MNLRSRVALLAFAIFTQTAHADLMECFQHAAKRRHVSLALLLAVAHVESRYKSDAINASTGAIGVMQIMPFHLRWLRRYGIERTDLLDGCTNINVGAFLLSDFIRMYGNTWRAVGAYGAGIAPNKEGARIEYASLVQTALAHDYAPGATHHASLKLSTAPSSPPVRPILVIDQ